MVIYNNIKLLIFANTHLEMSTFLCMFCFDQRFLHFHLYTDMAHTLVHLGSYYFDAPGIILLGC